MRQKYTYTFSWMMLFAMAIFMNFAFADGSTVKHIDTTNLRNSKNKLLNSKNPYMKNGLHLALPPLKPAATSTVKVNVNHADDKLLSDVQVYPNPIIDQISIKYNISHNAIVTVKIMDILGNEVATMFSQIMPSGEQSYTYPLNNKLSRGLYFVRIVAGTESVIKRISVL